MEAELTTRTLSFLHSPKTGGPHRGLPKGLAFASLCASDITVAMRSLAAEDHCSLVLETETPTEDGGEICAGLCLQDGSDKIRGKREVLIHTDSE